MHARTRSVTLALVVPAALAVTAGPLAGAAVADPPTPVAGTFHTVAGSLSDVRTASHGQIVVTTFTETSVDTGENPGATTTRWTCARREGTATSRCTGEGQFDGADGAVVASADVRLTGTCTESGVYPELFVRCEGRFHLVGTRSSAGLHGQATWQSAGLFGSTVTGTSELRLHDHR